MDLNQITNQRYIQDMDDKQRKELAKNIQTATYNLMAKTGGYVASNLSVVDLSIALHTVFDVEADKLIFDGEKHSKVHNLLLNQYGIHTNHIYTSSISVAIGIAKSRKIDNKKFEVVSILGEGSINDGINFEALRHLSENKEKIIIIYNDTVSEKSIVGNVDKSINRIRTSKSYNVIKDDVNKVLSKNIVGKQVLTSLNSVKEVIKKNVLETTIFREFGIEYLGPIDGHNIKHLITAFNYAKNQEDPIIIHVVTKKGNGIKLVEDNLDYHYGSVGPYDPIDGRFISTYASDHLTYSQIAEKTLSKLFTFDNNIVAVSTNNLHINNLNNLYVNYPNRVFNISNSVLHASVFAAGLASDGKHPYFSISSNDVQSIYKQINNDISKNEFPIVIGINNAGIVSDVSSAEQGVFDISLLTTIPKMTVMQGKNINETMNLLYSAFKYECPSAIRYNLGTFKYVEPEYFEYINKGTWTKELYNIEMDTLLITYGDDVEKISKRIQINGLKIGVINARFLKPIDKSLLDEISLLNIPIFVYENEMLHGGLSTAISNYYNDTNKKINIKRFGIDDVYIESGSIISIRKDLKLDTNVILNEISESIERK